MPIFEYICKKCDNRFELLVRASASPQCPQCNSKKLEKQFSTFASSGTGEDFKTTYLRSTGAAFNAAAARTQPQGKTEGHKPKGKSRKG